MFHFNANKCVLWTLLVLQLLCVLLYPTNGRISLADEDTANGDQDQEAYEDETQDEDWEDNDDDEDTKEYLKIGSAEEDLTDDPCFSNDNTPLRDRCLETVKCCKSSKCAALDKTLFTKKNCDKWYEESVKALGPGKVNPA